MDLLSSGSLRAPLGLGLSDRVAFCQTWTGPTAQDSTASQVHLREKQGLWGRRAMPLAPWIPFAEGQARAAWVKGRQQEAESCSHSSVSKCSSAL